MAMGMGNRIVVSCDDELLAAMFCMYRSCRAHGLLDSMEPASSSAGEAFFSPSADITWWKGRVRVVSCSYPFERHSATPTIGDLSATMSMALHAFSSLQTALVVLIASDKPCTFMFALDWDAIYDHFP